MSRLQELNHRSQRSRARDWKEFSLNYEDIKEKTIWAYKNSGVIQDNFPRTKKGLIYKNRHQTIKEYSRKVAPSGQSLFSRGFEGTNYRLVVASDTQANISCRYGEHLNLSGSPLLYRDGYPKSEHCEFCKQASPLDLCVLCGRWFCHSCGQLCEKCNRSYCLDCCTKLEPLIYSNHDWLFHRTDKVLKNG